MTDIFVGSGRPISEADFATALTQLEVDKASVWAILAVETKGFGYFRDRRPKILFERHIFSARTNGAFDQAFPDISGPQGGYVGGAAEYGRLTRALTLNRKAALESASWGLGQVMGFNASAIGYPDAEAMVAAFVQGESAQLNGCVAFIKTNAPLLKALKGKLWDRVAFYYNGKDYAKNLYDTKLRDNYSLFAAGHLPEIRIRSAQARLFYLGYDPRGIDGVMGSGTRSALVRFQTDQHMPTTGSLEDAVALKLEQLANC